MRFPVPTVGTYPLGRHPHPLLLPLPPPPSPSPPPSPCLPVSMDSAGDAVVLSHVPSIPLVLLFFFPFPFSSSVSPLFRNRLGSRGVRMPMDVHSRWSLVRTDWMIQGGTRHHSLAPKEACSAARHLSSSTRRLSVCLCV
ncbi:hypothetical protein GE21DRAFT_1073463 [Neurospora crassa]|nr:hypothetical protein GE21DRAFT_1073463 [Neurospora crassa]